MEHVGQVFLLSWTRSSTTYYQLIVSWNLAALYSLLLVVPYPEIWQHKLHLLQKRASGVIRATAAPYSRGQWGPVWRAYGMSCLRRMKVPRTGIGTWAPPPAQSPACCRILAWKKACSPPLRPANASADPCRARTSWVAVPPGALRALACGQRWRRGGAIVEEASSAVSGTRSSASPPCSAAPALASPLAATLWSCPASPSVPPAPPPSQAWRCPPLNPRRHRSSTSPTNRSAYQSSASPRLPVPPIRPRSWSAAADKGVSLAVALSHASIMTRRSAWSAEDQPTPKNRGLPWTWLRWRRLVFIGTFYRKTGIKITLTSIFCGWGNFVFLCWRKNTAKIIRRCLKSFLQALLLNEDEPAGVFLGHIPFCGCVFSPCAHGECELKKKRKKKKLLIWLNEESLKKWTSGRPFHTQASKKRKNVPNTQTDPKHGAGFGPSVTKSPRVQLCLDSTARQADAAHS